MSTDVTTTPNAPFSELGPVFDTFSAQHRETLARLSHELRTPLTSIMIFAEILMHDAERARDGRETTLAESERVEFLQILVDEADRLKGSIERLLSAPETKGE